MVSDDAVAIDQLSKTFKLPHERVRSVKSLIVGFWRRKHGYEKQHVLHGVSFTVKNGEFFGIVGRNGSGKSTLLKLLAGIYVPDSGTMQVNGRLVPFIELGVGFNPELTGRENVYLNGALLGFNRQTMGAMYKDIVEFAELGRFMDQKLKNYSSGMQVRLAFSIAIRAQGDILLLDEVLAVGDSAFQQKCLDYFARLKKEKKTIILVSHNMQIIEQFCDRALLLEKGKIEKIGSSTEITALYEEMFITEEFERMQADREETDGIGEHGPIEVQHVATFQDGQPTQNIKAQKPFEVHITLQSNDTYKWANVGINIKNRDKTIVVETDTQDTVGNISLKKGKRQTLVFRLENILTNGAYAVNIGVAEGAGAQQHVRLRRERAAVFTVQGIRVHARALTHPKVSVSL